MTRFGTGGEHDETARFATDGNATTYWRTEHYNGVALNKPGVGLVLDAGRDRKLSTLVVTTDTPGFTAVIKAGPSPNGSFTTRLGVEGRRKEHDVLDQRRQGALLPRLDHVARPERERSRERGHCTRQLSDNQHMAQAVEERKLATVLFADLVGSTELGGSQDPERTRALLNRFYAAMAEEVEHAGGTVEKFAGDAVMAAFGAPAALEDHAERALHVALAMLQARA